MSLDKLAAIPQFGVQVLVTDSASIHLLFLEGLKDTVCDHDFPSVTRYDACA